MLPALSLIQVVTLMLDESSTARLVLLWLPVSGLEALFPALGSTTAVADEGLVVCACVVGLWLGGCACKGTCISKSM